MRELAIKAWGVQLNHSHHNHTQGEYVTNQPRSVGRPPKPAEQKRRQIKVYVDPDTEAALRAGIGLKKLGHWLDENCTEIDGALNDA